MTASQDIKDAASLLVLRRDGPGEPRVLMGQRGAKAAFMPSKFVFPGGAVDPGDAEIALAAPLLPAQSARLSHDSPCTPEALAVAAIRELWEETGLLLGRPGPWRGTPPADWRSFAETGHLPAADALRFVFRAITPPGRPRRFDARFFTVPAEALANDPDDLPRGTGELSHLAWIPLSDTRRLDLPFITEVILAELRSDSLKDGTAAVPFYDSRGDRAEFRTIP